jgi:hypothetical protein
MLATNHRERQCLAKRMVASLGDVIPILWFHIGTLGVFFTRGRFR